MSDVLDELPEVLKIGYADWTVEVVPHQSLKEGEAEALGVCDKLAFKISIEAGHDDRHNVNTFLHELLHAIYFANGLPDEIDEETAVTSLANGLQAAITDNLDLQIWVANHLCGDIEYA